MCDELQLERFIGEQLRLWLTSSTRPGKPSSSATPTPATPPSSTQSPSSSSRPSPAAEASPSPSASEPASPEAASPTERVTRNQPFTEELGQGVVLKMVYIPGGRFLMGSPRSEDERDDDEGPQHEVTVPAFYVGQHEVTNGQWKAVMNSNPSGSYDAKFQGDLQPVVGVSWEEAQAFCQKLPLFYHFK